MQVWLTCMQLLFGTARAAFYSITHWRLTLEWNNVLIQSHFIAIIHVGNVSALESQHASQW